MPSVQTLQWDTALDDHLISLFRVLYQFDIKLHSSKLSAILYQIDINGAEALSAKRALPDAVMGTMS